MSRPRPLFAIPVVIACCCSLSAGSVAAADTEAAALADVFSESTVYADLRMRTELGDQEGLRRSHANTARIRLGLKTPAYHGVLSSIELEHTSALHRDHYNGAPGLHGDSLGRQSGVVIGDPESTSLNQLWIGHQGSIGRVVLGRQRFQLDEGRFIGSNLWRQNDQTFDGVSFDGEPVRNLQVFGAWVGRVNRVFGSHASDLPRRSPAHDFDSNSQLLQLTYRTAELATLRGYAYRLDLRSRGLDRGSSNTYGLALTGAISLSALKLEYRAEYARQTEARHAPRSYRAPYYRIKALARLDRYAFGIEREVLGDGSNLGFATPLAALHPYNGYADLFLNTPANGLADDSLFASAPLPGGLTLEASVHRFRSVSDGSDYGREIDVVAKRPLPWNAKFLAKLASYRARDQGRGVSLRDTLRFTAQLELTWN